MKPLAIGTTVLIQSISNISKKWDKSGTVVEVLLNRQYHVRTDGSGQITLRNRRHLRQIPSSITTIIPTVSPNPTNDTTASPNPTNDTTLNQTTNYPEVTHNIIRDFQ